jgi:polysaccharide pyruvyl transferase WcaK-like protein
MSVCVFLGGFGFGNLGDEACLETSFKLFRLSTNCAFTANPTVTGKVGSFDLFFKHIEDLFNHYPQIDRVVCWRGRRLQSFL